MADRLSAKSFRDLRVWQLGKALVLDTYRVTQEFPRDERFGLVAQLRRAAVSIPSNIAEGFNRHHRKEYRQFLFVALGSCGELETQVEVAHELGYIGLGRRQHLLHQLEWEAKMLRTLITCLDESPPAPRPHRPATSN
jgi:four helix bundle protein